MFLVLLLLGLFAGVLAGLFGIGGGLLYTPILFFIFNRAGIPQPQLWAVATSLLCVFITTIGSTFRQRQQKNVYWKEGLTTGFFGALGTVGGKFLASSTWYSPEIFAVLFSTILLVAAYRFIRAGKAKVNPIKDNEQENKGPISGLVSGGLGGTLATMAGTGGGIAMVPMLHTVFRKPLRKAVSISSMAIVMISLSGWSQWAFSEPVGKALSAYHLGFVDFGTGLPLVLGGMAGGFLGAYINAKVRTDWLRWGFALLAVVVAAHLLLEVF